MQTTHATRASWSHDDVLKILRKVFDLPEAAAGKAEKKVTLDLMWMIVAEDHVHQDVGMEIRMVVKY